MRLVFDIEGDNFLDKVTQIHCIVAMNIDTEEIYKFRPNEIQDGLNLLSNADMLIGHNILDYDMRAIRKLYPDFKTKQGVIEYDTLIVSKLVYPDIKEIDFKVYKKIISKPAGMRDELEKKKMRNIGRHSLEAYGLRMGEHKGDFGKEIGFDTFSEEMLEYCVQDVIVNKKLYDKLEKKGVDRDILLIETEAQKICLEQTEFGFNFDIDKAYALKDKLESEQTKLQKDITDELGGVFIIPIEVKIPTRSVNYKDVLRGSEKVGCPYTKIKIKEFNPTSRHDLGTRLIERFNWKPRLFGNDGKPTIDEATLVKEDNVIFKKIAKMFMIQKRLGMLSEGRNAWIKLYNKETGAIHGRVNTLGTGTHRCTHNNPNLAQIPSTRAAYGKECRGLFTVPKGWRLFDTDLSGLELRMLAHYMYPWDKGDYAEVILNGDIHTKNQEAAGLPTRDMAKVFIYAKCYGSGVANLAEQCGMPVQEMRKVVKMFDENLPALKKLTDAVKETAEIRGFVKAIDGRRIPVRSAHSALNFLLQSSGAIVAKQWLVESHRIYKERGYISGVHFKQVAYIHDQYDIAFDPKVLTPEILGEIAQEALNRVKERLNVRIELGCEWSVGNNFGEVH